MKKIKSLFLPFVTILVVMSSGAGCKKSGGKSSEAVITAFSFETPTATGTITGTDISVVLTEVTDLTKLVATFTLSSGATAKVGDVLQVSGTTPNDFTSPVEYIVTAQDGITINRFNVTVNIQTETSKEIKAFSFVGFESVMATITDTAITVALPAGTPVTALIANFSTTGASVKIGDVLQVSGETPNDFTSLVTYIVTAKDGSTKNYAVTVSVPTPTSKDITAFSFVSPNIAGTISGTDINITVPTGTDVTALVANFTTTGTSVKIVDALQTSGTTANNFTSPVTYIVTAQDNSTKNYKVTVTVLVPNYVAIPDAAFLTFLKGANGVPAAFDGTGVNADKLNRNHIAVFLKQEITCQLLGISDLTGIEYFVNLTSLICRSNNNIASLDVSKNIKLTSLDCSTNNLTSLDVSKNTALTSLICGFNPLVALDISSQTSWTQLTIYTAILSYDPKNLATIKVNVSQKDNAEVKKAKTKRGANITISTYTNSSADASPACANYDPNAGSCTP